MLGEPQAKQLIEAVSLYLEKTALPKLEGHAAFHGKVAMNVLAIIGRELEQGPTAAAREAALLAALGFAGDDLQAQRRSLCDAIHAGAVTPDTPGLLPALCEIVAARVAIEQPGYASLRRAES
jgi:hypothetical protein